MKTVRGLVIGCVAVVLVGIGSGTAFAAFASSSWIQYGVSGSVCGSQRAAINTGPAYAMGTSRTTNNGCSSLLERPAGWLGASTWMESGSGNLCKVVGWNYSTSSTSMWSATTSTSGFGNCTNPASIRAFGVAKFYTGSAYITASSGVFSPYLNP